MLAGPGNYLLRLRGTTSKAGKELVDNTRIQNSGDIWKVDTGERNWADARALTDAVPDATAPLPNAAPGRLSETRWPAAAPDFMLLASVGDTTLRSILANALVEAGVFENGSEQEKRRIVLYWGAAGGHWATTVSTANVNVHPWGGRVRRLGRQTGRRGAAVWCSLVFNTWGNWGDTVSSPRNSARA